MLSLLECFLSLQTYGYGLQATANVTAASKAHGHFSSQMNSDKLVHVTAASPMPKRYTTVVSSDYEHTEEKSQCFTTVVH